MQKPRLEGQKDGPVPSRRSGLWIVTLVLASLGLLTGCDLVRSADQYMTQKLRAPSAQAQENPAQAAPLAPIESKPLVMRTQKILAKLGYRPGPSDGVPGPKTRKAITLYQQRLGLSADGRTSYALLYRLERSLRKSRQTAKASKPAKKRRKSRHLDLPDYGLGSTFVYSDGRVDTVVGLKNDMVRWSRNDGTRFTTHRNFLLPWAYWESAAQRGTQVLDREPEELWLRAVGEKIAFSAKVVKQEGGSEDLTESTEAWRCRLTGAKKIRVVAGTFDTLRLACDRAAKGAMPRLTRVWYYAPAIRHYVRLIEDYDGTDKDRHHNLVAIRPGGQGWPPIARAALSRAVEKALDTAKNGQAQRWSSSGLDTRVTIEPTSLFRHEDGTKCRTFVQTWVAKKIKRRYPGAACQDDAGRWRIPGLEDDPSGDLAISNELS